MLLRKGAKDKKRNKLELIETLYYNAINVCVPFILRMRIKLRLRKTGIDDVVTINGENGRVHRDPPTAICERTHPDVDRLALVFVMHCRNFIYGC